MARLKTTTRRGTPRSKATINRELELLSRIFSLAVSTRKVRANSVREVQQFRGEVRRTRYLMNDEEQRLWTALEGTRRALVRLAVLIALNTGLRLGEILKLTRIDVDFVGQEIQARETKTDENRVVPMNDVLCAELQHHCAELTLNDPLFHGRGKTGLLTTIKRAFTAALADANITDFRFHDLRHVAATRMAAAGADPFTIARILGHKSIQMTARYAHALVESMHRAVSALETGPQMGHKVIERPLTAARN